jgi:hypothetical protein
MTDLQFTYDFIRKSQVVKDNLVHMTDQVMARLKYKGVEKLAKMLLKHKILTFFNRETNLVIFVKKDNPYLITNTNGSYFVGVYHKDDQVIALPYTKNY